MASLRTDDIPRIVEENLRREGLSMPDVKIEKVSEDREGVKGTFDGKTVKLYPNSDSHTVLHEIGHAWTHQNLNGVDRLRLARAMGLPTWDDRDHSWNERANEKAAEVFAWKMQGGEGNEIFEKYWKTLANPIRNRQNIQFLINSSQVSQKPSLE